MKKIVPDPPILIMTAAPILYSGPASSRAHAVSNDLFLSICQPLDHHCPVHPKALAPSRNDAHNVNVASAPIKHTLADM